MYEETNRLNQIEENMTKECIKEGGVPVKQNDATRYVMCFKPNSLIWTKDVK